VNAFATCRICRLCLVLFTGNCRMQKISACKLCCCGWNLHFYVPWPRCLNLLELSVYRAVLLLISSSCFQLCYICQRCFLCLFAFDIQHSIYCVQLTSVFFCRLAVVSVSCVYFLRLSMLWLLAGQLDYKNASSSPLMDNTWIMMIVWRTRRKISRTAMCCVVYHRCA